MLRWLSHMAATPTLSGRIGGLIYSDDLIVQGYLEIRVKLRGANLEFDQKNRGEVFWFLVFPSIFSDRTSQ